jgi:DNA-binding CsgD family transcriptional regulator
VLLGLCEGHLPAEIAADNNVAISTVRTQITRLRQKTDAASIGEIVLCVARLPPIRVLL